MRQPTRYEASCQAAQFAFACILSLLVPQIAHTKDYVIVLGGGPNKEQNQASMEANVQFFQHVLQEKGTRDAVVSIFFADGDDPSADLQILADVADSAEPVTDLIEKLHRRGPAFNNRKPVSYRNHELQNVAGATNVRRIRREFQRIAQKLTELDRVIVYVTAHGHAGPEENPQNTSIACWGGQILASEMMEWLDQFPKKSPVFLVMAQCYTGGFANAIFEDIEARETLSEHTRIGFFAQQFDLPAAGCRPDIEEDQEFSSYFWGAMLGETRNGESIIQVDLDRNGVVSWDEAFANMMITGETIDIPLRGTDQLLKQFSRIPDYVLLRNERRRDRNGRERNREETSKENLASEDSDDRGLSVMSGTIDELIQNASISNRAIVQGLCRVLQLSETESVSSVFQSYEQHLRDAGQGNRGRRGRGGSGRRELLAAIFDKWPELKESDDWNNASCLKEMDQLKWIEEIHSLPEFARYDSVRTESESAASRAEKQELTRVKYRRLIETLETIVLEKNLARVAPENVIDKFNELRRWENTGLGVR